MEPLPRAQEDARPLLIYPRGLTLGAAETLLAEHGIELHAAAIPFVPVTGVARTQIYLIEVERLAELGTRNDIERTLEKLRRNGVYAIVLAHAEDAGYAWLSANPYVTSWLTRPLDPYALLNAVRNATHLGALSSESEMLREKTAQRSAESDQLLGIGLALSAERDIEALQRLIVRKARELTSADGGSLFLVKEIEGERKLRFAVAQTGPTDEGTLIGAVLPLSRASITGYVAMSGEVLRIEDAYEIGESREYRFNSSFDKANNYRTKSVMCVPMRNRSEDIIGVIMLINRKPSFETVLTSPEETELVVRPFSGYEERVLMSLASQAAVALENKELFDSIQELFEQFVHASVKAIEGRDRATQGHSERVAQLTVAQAEAINSIESGSFADMYFNSDQMREMRYASLLHDFGKVAVPEYIFSKSKKLPDGRLDVIRLRFRLAMEQAQASAATRKLELLKAGAALDDPAILAIDEEAARLTGELGEYLAKVTEANEPRVVAGEMAALLDELLQRRYLDGTEEKAILDPLEYEFLKIPRGSLSNDERDKMQLHVTQSYLFLREIPWIKTPWQNVADIAYGHHEHLDGTGYPRGLKGAAISPQVRMMTISDVYDALTANDRPYKPAMPVERALEILTKEFAERGKCDAELLDVFIQKRVFETYKSESPV